jgi:hypothetical protein
MKTMETQRAVVTPDEIREWFDRLSSVVDGIPRQFVFNMDEAGCSDHSDSREVGVIAPIEYPKPWVPIPYERHSAFFTFVACIAADGFRIKPSATVHRAIAERELKSHR